LEGFLQKFLIPSSSAIILYFCGTIKKEK